MYNIHQKIAALRRSRGCTQQEMARLCFLSFRTYQRIESGSSSPRLGDLVNLATGLNCSIQDLLPSEMETHLIKLDKEMK